MAWHDMPGCVKYRNESLSSFFLNKMLNKCFCKAEPYYKPRQGKAGFDYREELCYC